MQPYLPCLLFDTNCQAYYTNASCVDHTQPSSIIDISHALLDQVRISSSSLRTYSAREWLLSSPKHITTWTLPLPAINKVSFFSPAFQFNSILKSMPTIPNRRLRLHSPRSRIIIMPLTHLSPSHRIYQDLANSQAASAILCCWLLRADI